MRQLDEKTLVSGQIQPADVPAIKAQGVTMIVNNRPDGEDAGQPSGEDIERAATLAVEKQYPNPRPVTQEGVRELLEAALEGDSSYVEGTGG